MWNKHLDNYVVVAEGCTIYRLDMRRMKQAGIFESAFTNLISASLKAIDKPFSLYIESLGTGEGRIFSCP